ncbi:hypothetical protein QQF64_030088 [Cirrhinus molitorella]|uniref:Uncharacterized protein n=1 Tax=Cirrhinus molitorella TaxID=172907 RepID=A0ABR3N2I1_9TELE
MKCSFGQEHVQPPSSATHALFLEDALKDTRLPRSVQPRHRDFPSLSSPQRALVEGGLGNRVSWKLSRVSYAISLSCESFICRSHMRSITHMPHETDPKRQGGSAAQNLTGVLDYVS